jgi:predicted site-specific integrase-resolvase
MAWFPITLSVAWEPGWKSNRNVAYTCKYHVVWCPKYRRKVLSEEVAIRLKTIVAEVAKETASDILHAEVASGMNDQRRELIRLLNKLPRRIVVEHKDSLTRFGFNYFELLLPRLGWEVVVIDRNRKEKADLMKDLIAISYSFSARIYGLRRGREKAKLAREVLCAEPA